jgi:hypothetical protein
VGPHCFYWFRSYMLLFFISDGMIEKIDFVRSVDKVYKGEHQSDLSTPETAQRILRFLKTCDYLELRFRAPHKSTRHSRL